MKLVVFKILFQACIKCLGTVQKVTRFLEILGLQSSCQHSISEPKILFVWVFSRLLCVHIHFEVQ